MTQTVIKNARLLTAEGNFEQASILVENGLIKEIASGNGSAEPSATVIDAEQAMVTAGLIDLHIHGVGNYLFERSADDIGCGLRLLPTFGVTAILPTLYRVMTPRSLPKLSALARALDEPKGAVALGFHLEGPFLAIAGAGALTMEVDLGFLVELLAACDDRVLAMSISPEVPGIVGVVEHLVSRGIAPFITHTRASAEQTQVTIDAGARHATHFYDVFPPPPEAEPGVRAVGAVEAILADPRVTVDFICDGVHVHPVAIRAALAAKGKDGVIAISDANIGAGLPAGVYDTPWGFQIHVAPDKAARIHDLPHPQRGCLAGSALTMNRAVENLRRWLPFDSTAAWQMASRNPGRVLRLPDRGAIQVGYRADMVIWKETPALHPSMVFVDGKQVECQDIEQ